MRLILMNLKCKTLNTVNQSQTIFCTNLYMIDIKYFLMIQKL